MKLFNFLKKDTKNTTSANVQALSKNQLEKVIGGIDETIVIDSNDKIIKGPGKTKGGATQSGA
jgi:hypothetical protein